MVKKVRVPPATLQAALQAYDEAGTLKSQPPVPTHPGNKTVHRRKNRERTKYAKGGMVK